MRMEPLRKFAALIVTLALANYGVMAMASAHAHEHTGFHQVHAGFDGDHDRSDHQDEPDNAEYDAGSDTNLPMPEHSETGFHSHSTPQFGPADPGILLMATLTAGRTNLPDPDRFAPLHRDSPPFKPPRTHL